MTALLILGTLGVPALGALALGKYKEVQEERKSEELRNLYADVKSQQVRR